MGEVDKVDGMGTRDATGSGNVAALVPDWGRQVNACLTCGACCAFFRASFPYREADDVTPGGVPVALTEDLTQFYRGMKGTDSKHPRCVALEGEIGGTVGCSIHPRRSSTCRDFPASFEDGATHNERCDRARAAHGMASLRPEDWRIG